MRNLTFEELRATLDTYGYSTSFYRITAVKGDSRLTVISGDYEEFTKNGLARMLWWLKSHRSDYNFLVEGTVPASMYTFPNTFKDEIEKAEKKAESVKFWY